MRAAQDVLAEWDRLIERLPDKPSATGGGLVLTSDHGNIEDARSCTHTRNPAPLVLEGSVDRAAWDAVRAIADMSAAVQAALRC